MTEIRITDVTTEETTIRATIDPSRDLRRFFDEDTFFVEYDVDVSDVPEGILSIPVLAHVCPVAWATGADVSVPVVDEQYLDSLETVGGILHEMYPDLIEGGQVIVDNAQETSSIERSLSENAAGQTDGSNVASLFTGGVDSMSTFIRHRDEQPTLINVQGWVIDIDDEDRWEQTKRIIDEYGNRFGVPTQFVRSNMFSVLDWRMLIAHFNRYHDGGWYSALACRLGLTGLCAPLAFAEGYDRLYMAATVWDSVDPPEIVHRWDGRGVPWGSHPRIANNIRWSDTEIVHDGFDLSRQQRVETIADFVIETDHSDLVVRSCNNDESGENCSQCEKCFRTGFGLALEGVDPGNHGFRLTPDDFERAKTGITSGEWVDREHDIYWRDIQDHEGREEYPVEGAKAFFEWFQTIDIDAITESSTPPLQQRVTRTALRNMPYPVYKNVDTVYDSLKERGE